MRFFISKNGSTVVDKQALAGSDSAITALVDRYKASRPSLTVEELDETTFNSTAMPRPVSDKQRAWTAFKATSPTALQAIAYLAKELGLEEGE